jgi:cholinesterase/carboxylesterase 2
MRHVPAAKLKDLVERAMLNFQPLSDNGITLANFPRDIRLKSKKDPKIMARVPVFLGSTADEARMEDFMNVTVDQALRSWLPDVSASQVATLKFFYPIGSPGINNDFDQVSKIVTELAMQCPTRYIAEDFADADIKTWRFLYDASFANTEIFKGSGAYHSSEIQTLFGTFPEKGATDFQEKLSRDMQKAWGKFIKNPTQGPGWEQVPKIGIFGDGVAPGSDDKTKKTMKVMDENIVEPRCLMFGGLWKKGKTEE